MKVSPDNSIWDNLFGQNNSYICTRFGHVHLIQGMVSCPGGLFLMYVCPMLPLYAGSQPAPTRPSVTPTEAPKPSRETAPCILPLPPCRTPTIGQQLHGADSWARRNVRKLLPLHPLPVIIGLQPHIGARSGLRDPVKPSPAPPCVSINRARSAPAPAASPLTNVFIAGPLPAHHQQHSPPMLSPHHSQHHLQPSHSH